MRTIRWQSYLHPEEDRPYFEALETYLGGIAGDGFRYEVLGISPPDRHLHRVTELRCSIDNVRNAIRAERDGCAAFVVGHFQEPALWDMRALLDMPVVGLGETSLHYACTLGEKIGILTVDPVFVPWHEGQIRQYGLRDRVVAVAALRTKPTDYVAAFRDPAGRAALLAKIEAGAQPLLDAGCEVIVPGGALPGLLFAAERNLTVGGARVVNGVAAAAKHAEAQVLLRELTGVEPSRRGAFAKLGPEGVDEFLEATGGPL